MIYARFSVHRRALLAVACLAFASASVEARQPPLGGRVDFALTDLPQGPLRDSIERLRPEARDRAVNWMRGFAFPAADVAHLRCDPDGGIYYADHFTVADAAEDTAQDDPGYTVTSVPVTPFPEALKFHSRPGSPRILFIDFDGETVTGTAWNTSLARDPIPAVAFTLDSDLLTFNDDEQTAIKRVWQRVAEDYAAFDIDVTTEAPASFDRYTAHLLVTRNTDADGLDNPSSGGGGVAYVNVFGQVNYATYRPAWVYYNRLSSQEDNIAEAGSHEVGHNMGLAHDGTTSGDDYYDGHGSGDISWGTIMGTAYGENVSQWCRGEYYLANNTEDDLAIMAAKLQYRADDHGDTFILATPLDVTDGSNVLVTTPQTDPGDLAPGNKGVIERNTDTDVFSFVTGEGDVLLEIRPWISPAGSRGGNLDVAVRLYDGDEDLVAEYDPAYATDASVSAYLAAGLYYLEIRGTGAGDPYSSTPTGYTSYGSLGQYFISGTIRDADGVLVRPRAQLAADNITATAQTSHIFTVTYTDETGVDVSSIDNLDLQVSGPGGYNTGAVYVGVDNPSDGSPRTASYAALPSGSAWTVADNGSYQVRILSNAVFDVDGAAVAEEMLGTFECSVPWALYGADMTTDPGWSLEGDWAYGAPAGSAGDPSAAIDGVAVVGYNLDGAYGRRLDPVRAVTPAVDCSAAETVSLRFSRWLGLRADDTASIEASSNGVTWTGIWTAGGEIDDTAWSTVEYDLTPVAAGQASVYIRWTQGSNPDNSVGCGWNLDNVEILGTGPQVVTPTWSLTAGVNDPGYGRVIPETGSYPEGTSVPVSAEAYAYYEFASWSGDAAGDTNPVSVLMDTNKFVTALFEEMLTTNYPTPHWWLAQYGYTSDFEHAVMSVGSNGYLLWECWVAGLDPGNPGDVLAVGSRIDAQDGVVLDWNSVSGRLYSVHIATNPTEPFAVLPAAVDLPWTQNTYQAVSPAWYRVSVRLAP